MITKLTNAEIDAFLEKHNIGNLGCCLEGKPYVFPMAYVFHEDVIYGQTTIGKKIEAARQTSSVCFNVYETNEAGWQSVMCWGKFEELNFGALEPGTETTVAKLLTEKIGSIQQNLGVEIPYRNNGFIAPGTVDEKEATLFHIVLEEKTGRQWQKS